MICLIIYFMCYTFTCRILFSGISYLVMQIYGLHFTVFSSVHWFLIVLSVSWLKFLLRLSGVCVCTTQGAVNVYDELLEFVPVCLQTCLGRTGATALNTSAAGLLCVSTCHFSQVLPTTRSSAAFLKPQLPRTGAFRMQNFLTSQEVIYQEFDFLDAPATVPN